MALKIHETQLMPQLGGKRQYKNTTCVFRTLCSTSQEKKGRPKVILRQLEGRILKVNF